jgi:hypothetical protein
MTLIIQDHKNTSGSVLPHNLVFVYKTHGLNKCLTCKEDYGSFGSQSAT